MAYQKVFKLKKLRKQLSTSTALLVYKQTILPYFEYCDFLYKNHVLASAVSVVFRKGALAFVPAAVLHARSPYHTPV